MEVNGKVTPTLLINNGLIVDGSGRSTFKGAIAISGERIIEIGEVFSPDCAKIIDAEGLVVSPGFIDAHSHADKTLFLYPTADSFVMQGVTTTIGGNCGNTAAPLEDYWPLNMFWDLDAIYELRPFKYSHKEPLPFKEFKLKAEELYGLDVDWCTFAEFLARLEKEGLSVNHVPLVGHNTIRTEAMGAECERKPTAAEMDKMKRMVAEAMEAGAFGLSTGLDYIPGIHADTAEIMELVQVVKDYGGIYVTHLRSGGIGRGKTRPPANRIEGIIEAVEIGRKTGVPVQISHLLPGYRVDPPPPKQLLEAVAQATLAVIDAARGEGVDVTFDVIPNVTGGTLTATDLVATLAPWLREIGSPERLAESLRAKDFRAEITEAISSGKWPSLNSATNPYWMDNLIVTRCKVNDYIGKTIGEIARGEDADPLDTLFGIIMKDPAAKMRSEFLREEAVITFLKHPAAMVGLDTYTFDTDWQMKYPPYYLPHPNTYGGFPRYLRRYVNELGIMSLEEAIHKATYAPAKRFGLKERGVLAAGAYADIVLFDKAAIRECDDALEPRRYPQGIEYVIINGRVVVEAGRHTAARPGEVLRMR
ncbi:MAG: D-aminoacylase [Chloroflexi bacterium]|nr:D-aminoacylase [Chloroflexota bacterium]